ncbi:X-linked retinitis pigmentosa GTPase regulator-interacting protein 1 [Dromiciops gliroides]|uniref:X-linked retinitis pigmentosa GTPase regulator-interacting protein 1 n=1 Tax=Dromiciops gliroides TaxID=33562 RepID=UPI001CC5513D|nr:X-linked retinitis pigmentosa GTPase regulator-interacting protein 1 [Dromiciops gliroides]
MSSLLLVDSIAGDMPIRKSDSKPLMVTSTQGKNVKSGPHLSKMSRKELEDSYSQLQEESLLVKELSWKQEDQIKRMRTKLLRLTAEGRTSGDPKRSSRNLKAEETIENLKDQVWQLQRHNEGLNNRLLMYKQQLQVQSSGHSLYSYVQPRINTGRRQLHTSDARIPAKLKRGPPTRPSYTAPPTYKEHLMEEVRAEMPSELLCTSSRVQIMTNNTVKMDELELSPKSPEKMWSKDEDCEEKSSLEYAQLATQYRASIRENVELIQVMRLLHERSTALVAAKTQLADLQEVSETTWQQNQGMLSTSHNALLSQVDELNTELREKNKKLVSLESQLADMSVLRITVREFQDRVEDLKRERNLLKGNHDRLLKNMLNSSSQPHWSTDLMKERLQQKVSHLQEQLDSELAEKRKILLQLAKEQAENADLKQEVTQMIMKHKKEVELLQQKTTSTTTSSSQSDPNILQPSYQDYTKETQTHELNSLLEIQEEEKNLSWAYNQMKVAHAETALELEKTRDMLLLQHQINQRYQDELEIVKTKADNNEREHKEEWEKLNQLLDLKNNRIQQLEGSFGSHRLMEAQFKDVAYGTLKFTPGLQMPENMVNCLQLHQGENLFELHLHQACLSPAALSQAGDIQLVSFCTYSFYDFEIHCTPLAVGPQPLYDFTSQYVVRTDYLFLNYLQGALSQINLHQTAALDHNTLAVGWLRFDKVLETVEKVHGTAMLTGTNGEDFGTLDYWMRLKYPIAHCLQADNKRLKAQAYLSANVHGAKKAQPKEPRSEIFKHRNQLWVEIIRCCNLQSRCLGTQPSPYAIYQFFTFSDHDTSIIPASNHPHFGDQACFPVHMTLELDQYLRQTVLPIYVFDDNESELGWFLGKAQVPLLPLAQDKVIQGNFNLNDPVGEPNGSIELKLEWESHYLSPESSLKPATQSVENYNKAPLSVENYNEAPLSVEKHNEAHLQVEDYNEAPSSVENETDLHIEHYNEAPLSVENYEAPLFEENSEAPLSTKKHEANLSVEDYNEADLSIESYNEENLHVEDYEENQTTENYKVNPSIENNGEAKLSTGNCDEEKVSIENCDEEKQSIENCDEEKQSIENCDEEKQSIENCDEEKQSIENCDEEKQSIENCDEDNVSIENFEETEPSVENCHEDNVSIENLEEAEPSVENCEEAKQSIENENEMPLLVEDYNKAPEPIENYNDKPIEIPAEEENILFHQQANKGKSSGVSEDEPEECYPEAEHRESPSDTAANQPSEQGDEVSETQTTDSDDVIVTPLSQKGPKTNSDKICIEIVSLAFDPEAEVMSDESIQQVYVEYKFHDLPLSETETPVSLRKPRAGEDIHFHFNKVIDLNPAEHGDRRKFLFSMLQDKNPEQRQLKFIVVSEPEEQKNECQEVGYAYLELWQILDTGRDILEQEIDIVNPQDKATSIGKLKVSLQATDALQAIFKEMNEDMHL